MIEPNRIGHCIASNSIGTSCTPSYQEQWVFGVRGNVAESISNEPIIAVSTVLLAQLLCANSRPEKKWQKHNRGIDCNMLKIFNWMQRKEFSEDDSQCAQCDKDGNQGIHIAPHTLTTTRCIRKFTICSFHIVALANRTAKYPCCAFIFRALFHLINFSQSLKSIFCARLCHSASRFALVEFYFSFTFYLRMRRGFQATPRWLKPCNCHMHIYMIRQQNTIHFCSACSGHKRLYARWLVCGKLETSGP